MMLWRTLAIESLKRESTRLDLTGQFEDRVRSESLMRAVTFLTVEGKAKQAEGRAKKKAKKGKL